MIDKAEVVDILARITPEDVGRIWGINSEEYYTEERRKRVMARFEPFMRRSCLAAVRLAGVPVPPGKRSPGAIDNHVREYIKLVVGIRNKYARRIAPIIGQING
jgi:hypothetical protein